MGIAHSNLKDYFAELVTEDSNYTSMPDPSIGARVGTEDDDDNDGDSAGDQHEDAGEDEASNEDNSSNASDTSEQSAKPSQAPTELWLPQSSRWCLLPKKYMWVSENEDDDILPEIDEIELQRELKEEEGLDAGDLLASREYETELWAP